MHLQFPAVRRRETIGVLVQIERPGFALIWWPERTRRGSKLPRVKAQASLRTPKGGLEVRYFAVEQETAGSYPVEGAGQVVDRLVSRQGCDADDVSHHVS